MAKKAKRRPLRVSKTASVQSGGSTEIRPYHASTILHPDQPMAPSHKRRCALARAKNTVHNLDAKQTSEPTLADRFHALPSELRREIFSHLLVRPLKWQLSHEPTCRLTQNSWPIYPEIYDQPSVTCVRCFNGHFHDRVPLWRQLQEEDPNTPDWHKTAGGLGYSIWQNPWRSEYAPEVRNPFICSECWDLEFRPRPHPAQEEVGKRHLRCLCARRRELGVLMVCRRWYEEAGAVFYSRNTFAFESAAVLKGFVTCLPQRWREKVTRVSFMAYHPSDLTGPVEEASGWEGNRKVLGVWRLLQELPRLSYLELDAHFLSRAKIAHRLLKLSLRNVRRVCFVMHNTWPRNSSKGSQWIWPEYHDARLVVGGFAEEVARAIKGQRPRCGLRRTQHKNIQKASEREEGMEAGVMRLHPDDYQSGMGCGNVYFSTSATAYARLWWAEQKCGGGTAAHISRGGNGLHAHISTEYTHFNSIRVETREDNWRDWEPTSYRADDFGIRNLAVWREKAGWDFLFPIQPEEFLDETQKEMRGWEFLGEIEA